MAKAEYHYVITLQFRKEGKYGVGSSTMEGTVTAERGVTRQELYRDVYARACQALEISEGVALFCMLEPNTLGR